MTSKLSLGGVTFGREIDASAAHALLNYAVAKDIRFWDTAAVYGNGASEQIIGSWLAMNKMPATQITVATKIPPPYTAISVTTAVHHSLQRLQKETLDLLFLHNWHESLLQENGIMQLNALLDAGLIKAIGVSNFNEHQLEAVLKLGLRVSCIQNNHNLAVSDLTKGLIDRCRAEQIAIITYSPLGAGFLTGKHLSGVVDGSRFDLMPAHQEIYFTAGARERLRVLLKVAEKSGDTPALLALAWALHQPFVSTVLIGVREKRHIDQAIAALHFNGAVLQELDQLLISPENKN
ncbi:MAG: aldo/keto reductase [Niabella sp.]|nr:aldo/keto reductase [Niabella sp.]